MRAPKKVIAAMAMATMIGGTVVPAFAAQAEGTTTFGFTQNSGANGQDSLQTSKQYVTDDKVSDLKPAVGDIEVNGQFTRTIASFPSEVADGHYLQVTMPISLGYSYNMDKGTLTSANGKITNQSVYIKTNGDGVPERTKKSVKMSILGLEQKSKSLNDMEYVDTISTEKDDKVQVPFELVISKDGKEFRNIHFASMDNNHVEENSFVIPGNTELDIKVGQINKQKVVDKSTKLAAGKEASMSHKMKMKFEYLSDEE